MKESGEDAFSRKKVGWLVGCYYRRDRWYKTSKAFQTSMGGCGDFNLSPPTELVKQVGR